jgi:hypothetical protein
MGRRSSGEIIEIKEIIKKIILEEHVTSPARIAEILREQYWKTVSKQTLLNMCSEIKNAGLVTTVEHVEETQEVTPIEPTMSATTKKAIELEYDDNPEILKINERIKELEKEFNRAESTSDKCKLNSELCSAQKAKLEMKKILRETEMTRHNTEKKQYIVRFGEPKITEVKRPFFKADEKQKTIPTEENEGSE